MAKNKSKRKPDPKTVLKLPDLEQSKIGGRQEPDLPKFPTYDHAIREFIDWYCPEPRLAFNKTVVTRYRISLEDRARNRPITNQIVAERIDRFGVSVI